MYQRILVPLDGSKLAECVLPHVENIAKNCGTQEVILISVTERVKVKKTFHDPSVPLGQRMLDETVGTEVPPPDMPTGEPVLMEAIGKKESQAQRYLARIAKKLETKGVNVKAQVLLGNPAEEIVAYADNDFCDLIIMASHGRSGPSRWALGSITDKVFRSSCVPVLMVRGPGCVIGI